MSTALPLQQRTDGGAIASFVLGILGFVVFPVVPSILAIWFGVSAKRRMRSDPSLSGESLATAGIVLGVAALVLFALVVALILAYASPISHGPA